MPEGDTIHKIANYLAPRLQARVVQRVRTPDANATQLCSGQRVRHVFAKGKHLFIEFDNDWLLRSHLGGGPRVTRFEQDRAGRLWVYGRVGLSCLRCDDRISSARLGKDHRATYLCETCQR